MKILNLILVFATASSCTLKPKDQVRLYLELAPSKYRAATQALPSIAEVQDLIGLPGVLSFPSPTLTPAPPTALTGASGFTCFAVNVTGPGIPALPGSIHAGDPPPSVAYARAVQAGVPDAYPGIVSNRILPTPGAQNIELDVPAGAGRLIQLIGLKESSAGDPIALFCNNAGPLPVGSGSGDGYFEVGRAFVPNAFNDLALTLNEDYAGKPNWYQEYKRLKSQGNCKPWAAKFGSDIILSTASLFDAYYFALDVSGLGKSMSFNDVQVEVTTPAARTLAARVYVQLSPAPTVDRLPTTGYAAMFDSLNTVTVNGSLQQIGFQFPIITVPDSAVDTFVVIYSVTAGQHFQLVGEVSGIPAPINTAAGYNTGTPIWTAGISNVPHVMIGRCF